MRMVVSPPSCKHGEMRRFAAALALALGVTTLPLAGFASAQTVTITGGGWGHGIGMSQYGAYGRALSGASSSKILKHYYTGTEVVEKPMPSNVRVGLLQYRSEIAVSSKPMTNQGGKMEFRVKGSSEVVASGGPNVSWKVEVSKTGGVRLYRNGTKVSHNGKSVFGDPSHALLAEYEPHGSIIHVSSKGTDYAYGRMSFGTFKTSSCGSSYCLRLVLVVPMQKYLYGLGEVPSSWPAAVLQAQAIAGRTYAFSKSFQPSGQHRSPCDCLVYDSVVDQAYVGDGKRTGSGVYWKDWKGAVDDTKDTVILHSGNPIQALYSSSSGGHTEDNENVWGGSAIPYLRGVPDLADSVSANPNHKWQITMSWSDLSSKLNASYGTGTLRRVSLVEPFGVSGRVTVPGSNGGGVRIVGASRTVTVSGWSIRSALGLKDTLFRIVVPIRVAPIFRDKYRRLGGAPGDPTSRAYDVPIRAKRVKGRAQNFKKGRLTYITDLERSVWQYGVVKRKYDRMGRERSTLGMPASGILGSGNFRAAIYSNGRILWSSETGAKAVTGAFNQAYRRHGSRKGPLGLPTSDRSAAETLPNGGRRQSFVSGRLYMDPGSKKVFALWGNLATKYQQIGEASSACGYPTAHMVVDGEEASAAFQHGTIEYSTVLGAKVDCG